MRTAARFGSLPWYRRSPSSWRALRHLPARRLLTLYLAVFFLFAVFGFFMNLMTPRRLPLLVVLGLGVANGAYSVLYPWMLIHRPVVWVWVVGLCQGALVVFVTRAVDSNLLSRVPGPAASLVVTGQGVWSLILLSYICFIVFIRKQATEAIRMQNELELAHGIQQTLVPLIHSTGPFYEVYGVTRPSARVGGDLVDFIPAHDGDIAYVADVAGHGLQAGILMGMLKAAAHTALLEPTAAPGRLPLLLDRLDSVLPAVKESHMYAAFAAMQLGPKGKVRHAIAGHPPVLHYCQTDGSFRTLDLEQFPLGLLPDSHFIALEVDIAPGDLLLIATDGILETCNGDDQEFGNAALQRCVQSHASSPLPQIAAHILSEVASWGKQQDDQTLLIVRCLALDEGLGDPSAASC